MGVFNALINSTGITDVVKEFITDKDKQIELQFKIEEIIRKDIASAREHDKASYGINYVDAIRGLVRPVITAGICSFYIYAKVYNVDLENYDYAIISSILAFWFGGKAIEQLKR